MKIRTASLVVAILLIALSAQSHAQGSIEQTVDIIGQGLTGPVVAEDGGTLIRTQHGVSIVVKMPTPAPGSYNYPPANPFQTVAPVPGTPEVFTGWVFFFNNPGNCAVPHACVPPAPGAPAPNDFTEGEGGVYNLAGHAVSGGGSLNLSGHLSAGDAQFGGPHSLQNPLGAEIHVAIAPHGVLVPDLLPDQISTPVGSPPFWWVMLFAAP